METIKGYVEHIIYRREDNHYTIIELVADGKAVTLRGTFEEIHEGEMIEAQGEYTDHAQYGKQLKVSSYRSLYPEDVIAIVRYLGSGVIKGIGESLARRITDRFGTDTFRIMEQEPERLAEIKGISERKAREISAQFQEKKSMRDILMLLQKYGIGNVLAGKIYKRYGLEIYGILKENPYRLAQEIDGIGFKTADDIAQKIGIHADSDFRIRSGVVYTLQLAAAEGHMFLPLPELQTRAAQLLQIPEAAIEPLIPNMAIEKELVMKNQGEYTAVYAGSAYYAELSCAYLLRKLLLAWEDRADERREGISRRIEEIESRQQIVLDDLQKEAVIGALQSGVFILSGGPGTGKTTATRTIIEYFDREHMDFLLAAPTGRAAKRMQEATGYEAKTIHRLLELSGAPQEQGKAARFERNEDYPLEADAIIIDEMSMVDIYLLQALLKAIPEGTRLILVGDANQLPSVGPGQILRDMMESGCFPMVVLNKIFRQAQESDIIVNAHRIHEGQEIALDNQSKDFFFLERENVNVIYKHIIELISGRLPRYTHAQPMEIQVLTPMRKGALGVITLNQVLQKYLNPPDDSKREILYGDMIFREGDKVMQIKNNYQLEWEIPGAFGVIADKGTGVFNGDLGVIERINENARFLEVRYDENRVVSYDYELLDELELAYAVTIHKSQGSEYPAVILPLFAVPRMLLSRNLLYTGITRAKNCVVLLGSRQTIEKMIENEDEQKRYTGLMYRLRELIGKKEDDE